MATLNIFLEEHHKVIIAALSLAILAMVVSCTFNGAIPNLPLFVRLRSSASWSRIARVLIQNSLRPRSIALSQQAGIRLIDRQYHDHRNGGGRRHQLVAFADARDERAGASALKCRPEPRRWQPREARLHRKEPRSGPLLAGGRDRHGTAADFSHGRRHVHARPLRPGKSSPIVPIAPATMKSGCSTLLAVRRWRSPTILPRTVAPTGLPMVGRSSSSRIGGAPHRFGS